MGLYIIPRERKKEKAAKPSPSVQKEPPKKPGKRHENEVNGDGTGDDGGSEDLLPGG